MQLTRVHHGNALATTLACCRASRCYEDRLKWGIAEKSNIYMRCLQADALIRLCFQALWGLKWSEHSRTHCKPSDGHDNPTWSEKVDLQSFNRSVPVIPADESQPLVLLQLLSFNSFIHPPVYPSVSPFQCIWSSS